MVWCVWLVCVFTSRRQAKLVVVSVCMYVCVYVCV